jgi:CheY-like chemotaxis protein
MTVREYEILKVAGTALEAPHVFIVDDDPDLRELLSHSLKSAPFNATLIPAATAAVRLLNETEIDKRPVAIVLDLAMKSLDGLTCLKEIRTNEAVQHQPAIRAAVFTAYADEIELERYKKELNIERVFYKPSDVEVIGEKIADWLGLGQTKGANQ